jgi:cystathionine beta-lyase/cystathionine gamma-synthase
VRLAQHERDGIAVADFLRGHRAVKQVFHPAFVKEGGVASGQLRGFAGTFSFALERDDFGSVCRVIDALERFRIGVSWGGTESLVISPNRGNNAGKLDEQGIPRGLVRVSVGLEGAELLIDDLSQALDGVA